MTVSQRPERVDRDALIEAAVKHTHASHGKVCWFGQNCPGDKVVRYDAEQTLDAILPLIADAIEAEADRRRASMAAISWGGLTHVPTSAHYLRRAARLVRSLGGEQ